LRNRFAPQPPIEIARLFSGTVKYHFAILVPHWAAVVERLPALEFIVIHQGIIYGIKMPLTPCISCGNQCSDTESSCPKCMTMNPNAELKPCRSCGKLISTVALTCPQCGEGTPTEVKSETLLSAIATIIEMCFYALKEFFISMIMDTVVFVGIVVFSILAGILVVLLHFLGIRL
jgi:RNA polymerase subunit RPABC4/transcription elongation factor Spt4